MQRDEEDCWKSCDFVYTGMLKKKKKKERKKKKINLGVK